MGVNPVVVKNFTIRGGLFNGSRLRFLSAEAGCFCSQTGVYEKAN